MRPATPEQREDGCARAALPRLDQEGGQDEREVRDVDVGAGAEVEHGAAREDDRRRQRAGGGVDPLLAEAVRDPGERAEEDEGQDDGRVDRALGAEEGEDRAGQRGERVGRGGERDVVVGERPVGQVASPDQRVERVVVDEPAAGQRPGDETEQERPADGLAAAHGRGPYRRLASGRRGVRWSARARTPPRRARRGRPVRRRARGGDRCRPGTCSSTRAPRRRPGAADSVAQLPLPGWTVESTFTAVQYGTPGFPTLADATARWAAGSTSSPGGRAARRARRRRSSTCRAPRRRSTRARWRRRSRRCSAATRARPTTRRSPRPS